MKTILRITKHELSLLFYSPIAWVVLVIFMLIIGVGYTDGLATVEKFLRLGKIDEFGSTYGVFLDWDTGFMLYLLYGLTFFIPLLTMGLISKEMHSGSIKLVLSSPVKPYQFVFGKYLSIVVYCIVLTLWLAILMLAHIFIGDKVDIGLLIACLLSFFLLAITYSAIGLYISSLTSYQTVAAVGTLAVLVGVDFLDKLVKSASVLKEITSWLKVQGRALEAARGLYSLDTVFYFIIIIAVFLGFTIFKIKAQSSSGSLVKKMMPYLLLLIGAGALAYITTLPNINKSIDFTATKRHDLSKQTKELLSELDGPVKMTSYVNVLDHMSLGGRVATQNRDRKYFNNYRQYVPQLEMDYVYYYDTIIAKTILNKKGTPFVEAAKKTSKQFGVKFEELLTPKEIKKRVDLSQEDNRYLKIIQYNGKSEILRYFADYERDPDEKQISASIKRLLIKPPNIVFVTGRNERSFKQFRDKDYYNALSFKIKRQSLVNDGFDFYLVDLKLKNIPASTDILVVSDPESPYTDEELAKIASYLEAGGNAMILADPAHAEAMKPLLDLLNIEYASDVLLQDNPGFDQDYVFATFAENATQTVPSLKKMVQSGKIVSMPSAIGILAITPSKYNANPILEVGASNTEHMIDSITRPIDATVGMTLTKLKNDNTEQRIIVIGDADFLSNIEYDRGTKEDYLANNEFVKNVFGWLTNDEFPVPIKRLGPEDIRVKLDKSNIRSLKIVLIVVLPLIMALSGRLILKRRNKK